MILKNMPYVGDEGTTGRRRQPCCIQLCDYLSNTLSTPAIINLAKWAPQVKLESDGL